MRSNVTTLVKGPGERVRELQKEIKELGNEMITELGRAFEVVIQRAKDVAESDGAVPEGVRPAGCHSTG